MKILGAPINSIGQVKTVGGQIAVYCRKKEELKMISYLLHVISL